MKRAYGSIMLCIFILLYWYLILADGFCDTNKNHILEYDNSWAIIIGLNEFKHWPDLQYAENDVENVEQILLNNYNFNKEHIKVLLNDDATLENLLVLLRGDFINNIGENDRLFFFWAGHGETRTFRNGTEKGYLIPYDGLNRNKRNAYATYLSMEEIAQFSTNCAAKHILFLIDACYSGFAARTKGARVVAEETAENLRKMSKERGRHIITAGRKGEKVLESNDWGHSAFTLKLLNGIKHPFFAADENENGAISASELARYLEKEVSDLTGDAQTPIFANLGGHGEFIFLCPGHEIDLSNETTYQKFEEKLAPIPPPAEFVKFHADEFIMGDIFGDGEANERPKHKTKVDDFYILDHEVTTKEYLEFVRATGRHYPVWLKSLDPIEITYGNDTHFYRMRKFLAEPNHPVVGVCYDDAQAYCEWIAKKYRLNGRLPKEAEWEYVARRGGEAVKFPNGKDYLSHKDANLRDTGNEDQWAYTAPVGSFAPDVNGIKDMAGNVWEWCYDVHPGYRNTGGSGTRVIRGGGYDAFAWQCRASKRLIIPFSKGLSNVGFRVVLTIPE